MALESDLLDVVLEAGGAPERQASGDARGEPAAPLGWSGREQRVGGGRLSGRCRLRRGGRGEQAEAKERRQRGRARASEVAEVGTRRHGLPFLYDDAGLGIAIRRRASLVCPVSSRGRELP
jgi:hypothetical protein